MSEKGSRKTDTGKESVACQQHQFIALVPAFDFKFEPLRLKLPITSIWDGQNKANDDAGWFAFKNYTNFLRANGVEHTAMLVTKLKFDSGAAYPKLLFARDRFLGDEDLDIIVPIVESQKVKDLVSASWTPNGRDGVRQGAISGPEDNAAAAVAKDVTPKGPTPEEIAKAEEMLQAEAVIAEKAAKKAAKKAAAEEAARIAEAARVAAAKAAEDEAAEDEDDDDDGEVNLPGTVAAAPTQAVAGAKAGAPKVKATPAAAPAAGKPATAAAATPTVPAGVPAGMADLLSKWGD
jgi:hypothetical protein